MNESGKRWAVPGGHLYVLDDVCKGCGFCIEYCPRAVLVQSQRFNSKGYHAPRVALPNECVLCGFCQLVCPDFAIWTEEDAAPGQAAAQDGAAADGPGGT